MQFNKDYDYINQHSHQSTRTTSPQGGRGANHDHAQGGGRGGAVLEHTYIYNYIIYYIIISFRLGIVPCFPFPKLVPPPLFGLYFFPLPSLSRIYIFVFFFQRVSGPDHHGRMCLKLAGGSTWP